MCASPYSIPVLLLLLRQSQTSLREAWKPDPGVLRLLHAVSSVVFVSVTACFTLSVYLLVTEPEDPYTNKIIGVCLLLVGGPFIVIFLLWFRRFIRLKDDSNIR